MANDAVSLAIVAARDLLRAEFKPGDETGAMFFRESLAKLKLRVQELANPELRVSADRQIETLRDEYQGGSMGTWKESVMCILSILGASCIDVEKGSLDSMHVVKSSRDSMRAVAGTKSRGIEEAPSKRLRKNPEAGVSKSFALSKHMDDSDSTSKLPKREGVPCLKANTKRARAVATPANNPNMQRGIREYFSNASSQSEQQASVSRECIDIVDVEVVAVEGGVSVASSSMVDENCPSSAHVVSHHSTAAQSAQMADDIPHSAEAVEERNHSTEESNVVHKDVIATKSLPPPSRAVLGIQSDVPFPLLWARSIRRCSRRPNPKQTQHEFASSTGQSTASHSNSLNEMQRIAATGDMNTPLAIVAGAGTGKTTTLLSRVDHLVKSGALPKNILLLTFTNSSADDICDRLAGTLGEGVAHDVVCTTIHSFCLALLRSFGSRLGLGSNVKAAEKSTLRRFLAEAWPWSGLEKERKMCAKWLNLDILKPRRWADVFRAFKIADPDAFQECLLTPVLDAGEGRRTVAKEPRAVETEIPLVSLRDELLKASPSLQTGEFHHGFFFFGVSGDSDDGRCWWSAKKAFKLKKGARIPKNAVLQSAAYAHCDSSLWCPICVNRGYELLPVVERIVSEAPSAYVRLKFQVTQPPPKGSPAALRLKEDGTWRQLMANAVFLRLKSQRDEDGPDRTTRATDVQTLIKKPKKGNIPDLLKRIELAKRSGKSPEEFGATEDFGDMAYCWAFCEMRMREHGLVDFQDMLRMAAQLLEQDDIRKIVKAQQRHILVDEFQDVSEPQLDVLKQLFDKAADRSLCVVGDDDQTIYTWNGSTTNIFNMLQEHCSQNLQLVQLTENYRSSHHILQVGHHALIHNARRIPKALRACAAWANDDVHCPPPLLWECGAPEDEATAIADEIQVLLGRAKAESGRCHTEVQSSPCENPSEIAVLFRCFNFQGKAHHPLVHEFARRQIPYYVVRESPFWEQSCALDLLAYLRLVVSADDDSFARALAHPPRGCGKGVLDKLRERQQQAVDGHGAANCPPSLEQVSCQLVRDLQTDESAPRALSGRALVGLNNFLELIAAMRTDCALLRVDDALEWIATRSGYVEWFEKERTRKKNQNSVKVTKTEDSEDDSDDDEEDQSSEKGSDVDNQEDLEEKANGDEDDEALLDEGQKQTSKQSAEARDVRPQMQGKIGEAVGLARCFADRWESPFHSTCMDFADGKVPSLFTMCGQRLLKLAGDSSTIRNQIVQEIPEVLVERLTADCGCCGRLQIEDFMTKVALDPKDTRGAPQQGRKSKRKKNRGPARGVCISTIHAAKGLEWPVVFVARWNEGFLPMAPSCVVELDKDGRRVKRDPTEDEATEHREEERRLAHVAVTRAQRRLILTHVRRFSSRKKDRATISSLPLPEPRLLEGSPHAAMWTRTMPLSESELRWEALEDEAS